MSKLFWPAVLATLLASFAAVVSAQAPSYPTKPIKLVVGFPPGGPTDVMARTFSARLGERLKQPVIVDNRPGAGGNIAADVVARADKDGYTLLFTHIATHGIAPSLYAKLTYSAREDFVPVIQLVNVPIMLVVTPSLPVKNVRELIDYLRAHPEEVNFASGGNGTSMHLSGELFKYMTGTRMTHVPYKGSSGAYTDLITGKVQVMFDPIASIYPFVQSGRLRALAVGSKTRVPSMPDIPTVDESGVPDFEVNSWFGVVAPKGTPPAVIALIHDELAHILKREDLRKQLADMGAFPVGSSPSQFGQFIEAEIRKWSRVVQSAALKID